MQKSFNYGCLAKAILTIVREGNPSINPEHIIFDLAIGTDWIDHILDKKLSYPFDIRQDLGIKSVTPKAVNEIIPAPLVLMGRLKDNDHINNGTKYYFYDFKLRRIMCCLRISLMSIMNTYSVYELSQNESENKIPQVRLKKPLVESNYYDSGYIVPKYTEFYYEPPRLSHDNSINWDEIY